MKEIKAILISIGISPTPVRMLVYRCLKEADKALSLSDIEEELESVDKYTISRTLNTFLKHHLIHSIKDGYGEVKYETCSNPLSDIDRDTHVHFRCVKCGSTICLLELSIPDVSLPEGYVSQERNYVISGICKDCASK